jgi:hypothetical protein
LPIRVHCGFQHLIESGRRSLQLLHFFIRDRLLQSLLVRPNQAHDALPEIVFPAFFVFVIHGPSKKQNTGKRENGTDKTCRSGIWMKPLAFAADAGRSYLY